MARALVVERLDAAGSDGCDVRERARALRAAGVIVRTAVLSPDPEVEPGGEAGRESRDAPGAVLRLRDDAAGRRELERFIASQQFDAVIFAAADVTGSPWPRLPRPTRRMLWPAGGTPRPQRPAAPRADGAGLATHGEGTVEWIGWSFVDLRSRGATLPIWDGEYLLCPTALPGRAGTATIAAFAEVADEWSGVELVVLADVDRKLVEHARALGVGSRVHFVGPARRPAEWAWWGHAAAGLLIAPVPVSGGLVLRGLAAGCPLLASLDAEPCASVARWLMAQGASAAAGDLPAALRALLERGPEVERAVARGRALAAAHDPAALARRARHAFGPALGNGGDHHVPHAA